MLPSSSVNCSSVTDSPGIFFACSPCKCSWLGLQSELVQIHLSQCNSKPLTHFTSPAPSNCKQTSREERISLNSPRVVESSKIKMKVKCPFKWHHRGNSETQNVPWLKTWKQVTRPGHTNTLARTPFKHCTHTVRKHTFQTFPFSPTACCQLSEPHQSTAHQEAKSNELSTANLNQTSPSLSRVP